MTHTRHRYKKQTRSEMYTERQGWNSNYSCDMQNSREEEKDKTDFNITLKAHDSEDLNTNIEGHALCSVPMNTKIGIVYESWVKLNESKRWKERICLKERSENISKETNEKELRVRAFFFDPRLVYKERMKSIRMTQHFRIEKKRSELRVEAFEQSLNKLKEGCSDFMTKERANWLKANRDLSRDVVKRRVEVERKNRELMRLKELRQREREEMNMKLILLRDEADKIARTMGDEMRLMRHDMKTIRQELEREKRESDEKRLKLRQELERMYDTKTLKLRQELENQKKENERIRDTLREQERCHDEVLRHEVERKLNAMDNVDALRRELESAHLMVQREMSERKREEIERKRLKGVCEWYDVMLRRATGVCAKMSRSVALKRELPSPVKDAVVVVDDDEKDQDDDDDDESTYKLRQTLEKMAINAYEDVLDALVYVPEEVVE